MPSTTIDVLSHLRSAARLVVKKDTFATRIPPENKKIFAQKYWPEVRYIKGRRCQRWHYKHNIKHQPSVAPRGQPKSNHTYIEEAKALSDESITTLAKWLDISKEMFFFPFSKFVLRFNVVWQIQRSLTYRMKAKMHCWYVVDTLCPIQEREEKCLDTK